MSNRPKIKRDRVKEYQTLPSKPVATPAPAENSVASSSKTTLEAPTEPSSEKRSRRRKRKEKDNDDANGADFAAGVDFVNLADSDNDRGKKRKRQSEDESDRQARKARRKEKRKDQESKPEPPPPADFGTGADFIGFDDTDNDEEEKPAEPEKKREEREWDRGKPRQRSRDREERRRQERTKYEPRTARYTNHRIPWLDGIELDDCKNVTEVLHREVQAFAKWMSPTQEEDEIRGLIVQQIRNAVTSTFPDARVEPFGSYATKLYLPSGDIDLVILSDSMAYSDRVSVLHSLASTLKRARITDRVSIIAKARVPIVKFVTTHGMFNVDISINQANGLVGVDIVNGFLKDMQGSLAMRSLVLITKLFLSQRSMNEVYSGGLGSYAIVCLVVSFLQMHPKVRRAEIDVDKNLGVLVMEFFELYGCYFNYNETGISVRDGGTYFSKRQRGWLNDSRGLLLSIEDPADPSNDISSGSFGFSKVKATMAGAYGILTSTAYTKAGIINARRSGEAIRLREKYEASDLSILSSIMNVPQDTINHRRVVQEVYDAGKLHQIMNIQPLPKVFDGDANGIAINGNEKEKRKAHPSSDMEGSDSEDHEPKPTGTKRAHRDSDDDEEEDGGRYDIGKRPPAKRRRMGRVRDDTVFTTDDDDDEEDVSVDRDYILSAGIGLESGEDEEDVPKPRSRSSSKPRSKNAERNKLYWLAKGEGSASATPIPPTEQVETSAE